VIAPSPDPAPDDVPPPPPPPAPPREALAVLHERFGHADFRPGQGEVVAAALAGKDVLCVMPTGAGKSLCFQVPALLRDGVTLVVSPLIALMKDQVDGLLRRGIAAAEINSTVEPVEQERALDRAASGEVKLLYVAPERFKSERFRERIAGMKVSFVAIDEAHCISQWGHDFRPDYRRLGPAVELLGRPPVLALTATATREVQDDIVAQLSLREPVRLVSGVVRENLRFVVERLRTRDEKDDALWRHLRGPGASLVYCASRKQVERIHAELEGHGLASRRYHAGLPDEERAQAQEAFLTGGAPLLVATNAFGMGVDRPDIRRVVHFDIPRTVEAYVQEAGRAGRDGLPSDCVLLFHAGDLHIQRWFLDAANPSREAVTEVFRVISEVGERRLELTAEEISQRCRVEVAPQAVNAALAALDKAAVVRRGRRGENRAKIKVFEAGDDLFGSEPVPPGLSRLLLFLSKQLGIGKVRSVDLEEMADLLGRTEDTLRRGLPRLVELQRIEYVPPFRGRAMEVRGDAMDEDVLDAVDFEALAQKRAREERKLDQMVAYAQGSGCRAAYLLTVFGDERGTACGRCDACRAAEIRRAKGPASAAETSLLATVLTAVKAHEGRFGFKKLAEHLVGSKAESIKGPLSRGPTYGALKGRKRDSVEALLHDALDRGLLRLITTRVRGDRVAQLVALSPAGRASLPEHLSRG